MSALTLLFVAAFAGLVPMLCYTAILWWLDHWEREPLPLVIGCFLWGAVPSIVFSIVWSLIFGTIAAGIFYGEHALTIVEYSVIAPFTEEIVKGLGLLVIFFAFRHEIDSLFDGILYGAVIGFGFAAVENVFYFIGYGSEGPGQLTVLIFLRAILFGLNHAFFTGLTGLGLAMARFQKDAGLKLLLPLGGLGLAMVCHATHNFFAGGGLGGVVVSFIVDWFGIFWLFAVILWSMNHQGNLIRHYLNEEVAMGVLQPQQAQLAGSFSHRLACGFGLFGHHITSRQNSHRLDQLCAELAFKKHHLATMGEETGNSQAIGELRQQVAQISQQLA